ncbi:hypothetical protein FRX31_002847 [Thalictrum thalictroides]|uniref:Uncharacterized protein n=1 Tax=Thalictrum thalictroides TaxID=46969 RepID=A0A7J6XFC3_THATH|nr:hypothetical protein FRX31_002847 [Thalictrum thalictroides]
MVLHPRVRSGLDLNKWISIVVRNLVVEIGVSSNHGRDVVEKFIFELGMRQLKAKRAVELSEDEEERRNYENANDVLRDLEVT